MNKPLNPEIVAIENTLKLLRRGKFEMEGEEALAFFRLFEFWVKRLNELKQPPISVVKPEEIIKSPKSKKSKE
jgi:hypothetical protein